MSFIGIHNANTFLSSINLNIIGCRSLKSRLPIKWVRPVKIPCHKPEKSGDLKPVVGIDMKQYPIEFRDSEELKTANETVKKLFTLEYFPASKRVDEVRAAYLDRVQRHKLDLKSPEARVAKATAAIRRMQHQLELDPKNIKSKVRLKESIDKRRKLLKFLRQWDYKCYEFVLDKMDLEYKPVPPFDLYKRIERKRSLRMLTDKYCENIVTERLENYRKSLEDQQIQFLIDKIKSYKWIIKEELDCGLNPSFDESEIKAVEEKLETLRRSRENGEIKVMAQ